MGWHGQHLATYLEHGIAWPWASLGTRWPSSRTMDEHWVTHNFAVQVCPARQHSTKCQMTLRIATGPKISENIVKSPKMILKRRCKLQTSWSSCRCMSMPWFDDDKPRSHALVTPLSCPCHALVLPQALNCWSCFTKLLQGLNLLTLAWSELVWLKRKGQGLGADIASQKDIKRWWKRNKEWREWRKWMKMRNQEDKSQSLHPDGPVGTNGLAASPGPALSVSAGTGACLTCRNSQKRHKFWLIKAPHGCIPHHTAQNCREMKR